MAHGTIESGFGGVDAKSPDIRDSLARQQANWAVAYVEKRVMAKSMQVRNPVISPTQWRVSLGMPLPSYWQLLVVVCTGGYGAFQGGEGGVA
jgi:hypothetical protein